MAERLAGKRYVVKLSEEERDRLNTLIHAGNHPARQLTRARILLKADSAQAGDGWSDRQIATALDTSVDTVARTRQQMVEEGFEAVLVRKHSPASARPRIFDGAAEAKLIALACSDPPKGRKRWTLQLLEEHVVELKIVDRASDNTIGRTLKKTFLKPHLQKQWVIPPDANAAFVAGMEDVLEVYQRPHDPEYPVVCVDETSKQLVAETRVAIAGRPGQPARYDYEYKRNGTANLFMIFAPLEGWRHVEVTDRHTAVDYAQILKAIADMNFPKAKKIVLMQDNLNTHKPASLYEAFPAAEARRLVERFEWHYTPKHGSWLDMAESELSALSGQCLDRRIADKQTLTEEVAAWEGSRNKKHVKADWQFTTADARVKLKRLYPAL
ncbi:IS630 family transposase [Rhodopila sp.]|uniref:IS630 family transposase n=1 Tax=Rhodopila sp. TaxID=2480087 RepID=UPI003D0B7115